MGVLAGELRDTVRWGLMQTNSEKFCRQPVLKPLPACHYEKLLLLLLCTGPNINICILSSDCCHVFGWEVSFEGSPTLPWVDWFPNSLVSSQMGTLSIQRAARRGFVKCLSNGGPTLRSKIQVHFKEIRAFQPNERNCWRHKGSRGWKLYKSNFIFISSTASSALKHWSFCRRDSLSSMVTSSHYSFATMCWSVESLCST